MKRMVRWVLALHKRLYKTAVFPALLLLVLLSAVLLYVSSLQDSGFVRIVLVQEDKSDSVSSQIVADCMSENRLLAFEECATKAQAIEKVKTGGADAAWIFPADIRQKIERFAEDTEQGGFITVIEREQTVPLRLAREKLAAVLYQHCSPSVYIGYIRENIPQLDGVSDESLLQYYDAFEVNASLFAFSYPDSSQSTENAQNIGYLTAPVRGLLSVLVLVCGMAAVILYLQDAKKGTYSLLRVTYRPFLVFGNCITAIVHVSVVMLLSLYCVGVTVSFGRECLLVLLYAVSCTLFCMVLQLLCNNLRVLASLIPLLAVVMIGVCPVFFEMNELAPLQMLFPPTYYINAVHNDMYIGYAMLYCLALAALYTVIEKVFHRQK